MSWMETYYMLQIVAGGIVLAIFALYALIVFWMSR